MKAFYLRGLVPLGLVLAGALAAVPPAPRPAGALPGAEAYRRTLTAVGWVHATDRGKGTGWVLDRGRRWLITCYHVVGENDTVEVVFPARGRGGSALGPRRRYLEQMPRLEKEGLVVRGRVLRRNPATDLALVELASLPPGVGELPLAPRSARPGERGHVVGNRYDLEVLWGHGTGAVCQAQRLKEGYFCAGQQLAKGARVLLAQVPINEGDSGGPLVNERGEVIGVSAAVKWQAHGAGLFIDVSEVRALAGALPAAPGDELAARDVYRQGLRSLALVQYAGESRYSGFLLDGKRRLLLTTAEAVAREETVAVTFPVYQQGQPVAEAAFYRTQDALLRKKGARVTGVVLAKDARRNLALVELTTVPDGVAEVRFAREVPRPGDALHFLSNPARLAFLWLYGAASVRQLDHVNLGQTRDGPDPAVLIVQAALAESEGGGPLLDGRGELVGVLSGKIGPQQQVAFALAAAEVRAFLAEARPSAEPRGAAELCRRAALFVTARQYERAARDLDAALRLDRNHAVAYAGRAEVHLLEGSPARALADCDQAIRLDPRLALAYRHRAAARCALGEPARGLADCEQALRLDSRLASAFAVRGLARLLLGEADRASADADEALWLDRKLPLAYLIRGRAHAAGGRYDKAVADFSHALVLAPHLAEARRQRGDAHWARDDVPAALEDYTRALALDPQDAHAYHGRGRARAARGDFDGALADFNTALRRKPDLASAYLDRGGELARRGNVKSAAADCVEAVRRQPGLAGEALATVERRGAELPGERGAGASCVLYRETLKGLQPLFPGRSEVRKKIAEALARPNASTKAEAQALRAVLAEVRGCLLAERSGARP